MNDAEDLRREALALAVAFRGNEARRRTIVGRAYYAAFHRVLAAAVAHGHKSAGFQAHARLIEFCLNNKRSEFRTAGAELRALRTLRVHADYGLTKSILIDEVEECLERMEAIFEEMQSLG